MAFVPARPRPRPAFVALPLPRPFTPKAHSGRSRTAARQPRMADREEGPAAPAGASSRRAFLAVGVGVVLGVALGRPPRAEAVTLAPVPINAYGRRRRKRAYQKYLAEMQETAMPKERKPRAAEMLPGVAEEDALPFQVSAAAAVVASAFSTLVAHPIDTIKTRVQAGQVPIVLTDRFLGVAPLYRGLGSNILKEAPNAGIYLGIYELVKNSLLESHPSLASTPLLVFMLAGAIGDGVGSIVRVPAEIINKKLQLGLSPNAATAAKDSFLTPGGLRASLNVWTAILLRDVPYGALQIGIYEQAKLLLRQNVPDMAPAAGFAGAMQGISTDVAIGALAGLLAAFLTTPFDVLVTRLSRQTSHDAGAGVVVAQGPPTPLPGVFGTFRSIVDEEGFPGLWKGSIQRGIYYMPLIGIFFAIYEVTKHFVLHPDELVALIDSVDWIPLKDFASKTAGLHIPSEIAHLAQLPYGLQSIAHSVVDWAHLVSFGN